MGSHLYLIRDVWLLIVTQKCNARVGLWGEDVDEGVGVPVQRHRGGGSEELPIEGGEDADVVV